MRRIRSALALLLVCLFVAPQASAGDMAVSVVKVAAALAQRPAAGGENPGQVVLTGDLVSSENARPAPATPELNASIAREAEGLLQTSSGTGKNKYFWPGIALMAGGGTMMLLGLQEDAIDCHDVGTYGFTCSGRRAFGMTFGGLGAAVVGVFLFIRGEQLKERRFVPVIDVKPHSVAATIRIKKRH